MYNIIFMHVLIIFVLDLKYVPPETNCGSKIIVSDAMLKQRHCIITRYYRKTYRKKAGLFENESIRFLRSSSSRIQYPQPIPFGLTETR